MLAGLAVCAGIAALYLSGSLTFIDRPLTSARFKLVTTDPTDDVVVVEIDAPSLRQIAVWPWPRSTHATVIDKLLASTAIEHDLYLVTRNVKDTRPSGAVVFDPWNDDVEKFPLSPRS